MNWKSGWVWLGVVAVVLTVLKVYDSSHKAAYEKTMQDYQRQVLQPKLAQDESARKTAEMQQWFRGMLQENVARQQQARMQPNPLDVPPARPKSCYNCGTTTARHAQVCPGCGARYGLDGFR